MRTSLLKLDMSSPIGSLDSYIYRINQIPLLTAEEEQELAKQYREKSDLEAARRLVLSHLRFVVSIARGYAGYGLSQADLIQEGNVGLMKAVKRFDPGVGVRLVSFAVHWIKSEIHEFIIRNWRIVKMATTKAQRKLFFNLRKASKRLGWFTQEEAKEVAKNLKVNVAEVYNMEARLNARDEAYDPFPDVEHEEEIRFKPAHYLEDNRYDPGRLLESSNWSENQEHHLAEALKQLDARSKDILSRRWLAEKKATLEELAAKYNVSAERIRQLEKTAMEKLKETLIH